MLDLRNEKAPADTRASTKNKGLSQSHYRRLPPYGKQLMTRLRQGDKPSNCVWIACGAKAWDRARYDLQRSDSAALCLPFGADPTHYRWPVAGLDCLVVNTGGADTTALRNELIRFGANRAVAISTGCALPNNVIPFPFGGAL